MPNTQQQTSTAKEMAPAGILRAFAERLGAAKAAPAQRPAVDPQKARQALAGVLRVIGADNERGARARAAIQQIAGGLADLLDTFEGE